MIALTSYGFRSPIIREKIKWFIEPEGSSITIIPFASLNEAVTVKYERKALEEYGFSDIRILTHESRRLPLTEYIYVPGGDTFKLLHDLQKMGLVEEIRHRVKQGVSYIGVSAGAYISCKDIEYVKLFEDNNYNLTDYTALGILPEIVICHSDQVSMGTIANIKLRRPQQAVQLIRNDDMICTG